MNAQGKEVEVVLSEDTVSISNGLLGFDFNLKNGTYAGKDFKGQRKVFTGARFSIDAGQWKLPKYSYMWSEKFVSDYLGKGKTLNIKHVPSEGYHLIRNLKITLYENQPFAVFGFSVTNQFNHPVRVRQALIIDKAKFFNGMKIEKPQVLRGGAGAEEQFVEDTFNITVLCLPVPSTTKDVQLLLAG